MKRRISNQKLLGLCYLILAGLFGLLLLITFSFMSKDIEVDIDFIKNNLLNFVWFYIIFNFILSSLVGTILLFIKQNRSRWLAKIILFIGGMLIFLDLPPIVNRILILITKGTVNIPWTIIIFGFHIYLFLSLIALRKDLER